MRVVPSKSLEGVYNELKSNFCNECVRTLVFKLNVHVLVYYYKLPCHLLHMENSMYMYGVVSIQ